MPDKRKNIVLKVIAGPCSGIALVLTPGRHIVGSGAGCAVRIEHESVAALHAMLVVGDDVLRVYPVQRSVRLHVAGDREAVEVNGSDLLFGQNVDIGDAVLLVSETEEDYANQSIPHDSRSIEKFHMPAATELHGDADILDELSVGIESIVEGSIEISATPRNSLTDRPAAGSGTENNMGLRRTAVAEISQYAVGEIQAKEQVRIKEATASANSPDRLGKYSRVRGLQHESNGEDVFRTPAPKLADSGKSAAVDPRQKSANPQLSTQVKPQGSPPVARQRAGDTAANRSLAAAAQRTLASVAGTGNAARPGGNSRALVTVPHPQVSANEAFALVVSGAVNVSDNVSRGFLSYWREGFRASRPVLVSVLFASVIGLIFIADRQTQAVHDYSISPTGSLSAELVTAGFTEISVTEDADNRIQLTGFLKNDNEKRSFDQILSSYDSASISRVHTTVETELETSVAEILNQYGIVGLNIKSLGAGRIQIDGYVGPEQDWDEAVATLRRDLSAITELDDSGVETLALRLADLKFMMLDFDLGHLIVEPKNSSIAVDGMLPTRKIGDWVEVMRRFKAKYNNNPEIINKVEQRKPGAIAAVRFGTLEIAGRKYISVEPTGSLFGEGDFMPDGTQVRRIEKDRVVFFRNGYEYPQAYNSGVIGDNLKPVSYLK